MTDKLTSLLNESLAELDVRIEAPEKTLGLVEFCLTHTSLRGQELLDFCEDLLDEGTRSVIITESATTQIGQRIGHGWNTFLKGAGAGREEGNDLSKPTADGAIQKRSDQLGNFFGTRGSKLRNGGVIELNDAQKGITRYLVFPELDMARPGHKKILDQLVKNETKDGITASIVNVNDAKRAGIQSRSTEIKLSDSFKDLVKDRDSVTAALNDLSNYANQEKLRLSRYGFITPEEAQEIANQIAQKASIFGQAAQDAAKDEQTDLNNMTASVNQQVQATSGGTSANNNFQAGYAANATANIGPGKPAGATPALATGATQGTAASTNIPTMPEINPSDVAGAQEVPAETAQPAQAKTVSTSLPPSQYIRQGKRVSPQPAPVEAPSQPEPVAPVQPSAPNVVNFNTAYTRPETKAAASFTPTRGLPASNAPANGSPAFNYMFGSQNPRRALSKYPSNRVGTTIPRRVKTGS